MYAWHINIIFTLDSHCLGMISCVCLSHTLDQDAYASFQTFYYQKKRSMYPILPRLVSTTTHNIYTNNKTHIIKF
jgi:hypothetical protein